VTVHIIYNSFGESSLIIFCLLEELKKYLTQLNDKYKIINNIIPLFLVVIECMFIFSIQWWNMRLILEYTSF